MKRNILIMSMLLASSLLGLPALSQAQTSQDTQGNRKGALSAQTPKPQQRAQEPSRAQLDELNARADQNTAQEMRIFEGLDSTNGPATSDAQGRSSGSRGMASGGSTGSGTGTGSGSPSGGSEGMSGGSGGGGK